MAHLQCSVCIHSRTIPHKSFHLNTNFLSCMLSNSLHYRHCTLVAACKCTAHPLARVTTSIRNQTSRYKHVYMHSCYWNFLLISPSPFCTHVLFMSVCCACMHVCARLQPQIENVRTSKRKRLHCTDRALNTVPTSPSTHPSMNCLAYQVVQRLQQGGC